MFFSGNNDMNLDVVHWMLKSGEVIPEAFLPVTIYAMMCLQAILKV